MKLTLLFAGLVTAAFGQFAGSDAFTATSMDSSLWSVVQTQGNGAFTQSGDGVLHYTVSPSNTGSDATAWAWVQGTSPDPSPLPFASDWSARLDVSNPAVFTLGGAQFDNVGLGVRSTADINNLGYSVRLDTAYTDFVTLNTQTTQWEADKENGSADIEHHLTSATSGAVLLTWTAATHTLTAAFDEDGATGGYVWTSFSTYDPVAAWGMTSSDSFVLVMTGNSLNADGGNTNNFSQVYVDNLDVTNAAASITYTAVPEPATWGLLGGLAALGLVALRRRGA